MQNVIILCVGKLKESFWREAVEEYSKRLGAYCKFSVVEVKETKLPDSPSQGEIERCLISEGERLLEKIPARSKVYALCIEGKELSSQQLASELENSAVTGESSVVFIIGGSHGLSPQVKQTANKRISMSPMTFPHQLARVMLCEQIYRAFTILNDGKYHK